MERINDFGFRARGGSARRSHLFASGEQGGRFCPGKTLPRRDEHALAQLSRGSERGEWVRERLCVSHSGIARSLRSFVRRRQDRHGYEIADAPRRIVPRRETGRLLL